MCKKIIYSLMSLTIIIGIYLTNTSYSPSFINHVEAAQETQVAMQSVLSKLQGAWYDSNGKQQIFISGQYFNDCKILGIYDLAGSTSFGAAYIKIVESEGNRLIFIEWNSKDGYVDEGMYEKAFLRVNRGEKLHRNS